MVFILKKKRLNTLILASLLASVLLVSGCLNNSAAGADVSQEEIDLIKELEEIEQQLKDAEKGDVEPEGDSVAEINEDAVGIGSSEELQDEPALPDSSDLQRIIVKETELVDLHIEAEDSDKDEVKYFFTPPLDEKGMWQTNYTDAGEYVITVTADDGANTVEQKILLVVEKKNVAPIIEGVPKTIEIDEGEELQLGPVVRDLNEDAVGLTYSAPFDDSGLFKTDHTSAGEYDVKIIASDGELESISKLTLKVNDVNVPPELSGFESAIIINEGDIIVLNPVANDLDGDPVELSISEPVGDDGVWETGYTDNGEYVVTVAASDGKDTVSKEVTITVKDINVPPKIISIKQG